MSDELHGPSQCPPDGNAAVERNTDNREPEHRVVPPPWDAVRPTFSHPQHGAPSGVWPYKNAEGDVLSYIARYDPSAERKQFVPFTYCEDRGGGRWQRKACPRPRPLFGLDKLAARPDAPVLVTEGEKAAVGLDGRGGAAALLPAYVCITSAGGSKRRKDRTGRRLRTAMLWSGPMRTWRVPNMLGMLLG